MDATITHSHTIKRKSKGRTKYTTTFNVDYEYNDEPYTYSFKNIKKSGVGFEEGRVIKVYFLEESPNHKLRYTTKFVLVAELIVGAVFIASSVILYLKACRLSSNHVEQEQAQQI